MRRALALFWGPVLLVAAVGAATLQWLGPPARPAAPMRARLPAPKPVAAPKPLVALAPLAAPGAAAANHPADAPHRPGAPIAPPDPALLRALPGDASALVPRIGADGRAPMTVYAAGYDATDKRPRIGLLLSDMGMSGQDSTAAIAALPAAVSLAFSPYADNPAALLASARAAGHELFVSLPLEPQGSPLNDAGNEALLTGATAAVNGQRLDWALSRFAGYVGATGAMGLLHGERFAAATDQMAPVLRTLAASGLLYVDPRPGGAWTAPVAGRSVEVLVDEPALRTEIEAKLARLEKLATEHGAALGLVDEPAPRTVEAVSAWAARLSARGFLLVPVSALAHPAARKP